MWSLYEIIHIWTAVVDESEEWSSQYIFNGIRTRDLRDTGALINFTSFHS